MSISISTKGTLFVVATPIGNLGDASPRVLETLKTVDLIACEDTRHTGQLLHHFGIRKPMESYHDFNEEQKTRQLVERIEAGTSVALVSDAGTPAISDPGYRIVRACREHQIPVIALPGPNAAMAALSASGIPSNEFLFVGFLPSRKSARREKLESLRGFPCTLIFYEAPHRILDTLEDMQDVLGDRLTCVAREISKMHETYVFGKLSAVRSEIPSIGEFVVIVAGGSEIDAKPLNLDGLTRQQALKRIAEKTGVSRKLLYDLFMKRDSDSED